MAEDPAAARDREEIAMIGTADRPFRLTDQEQPWHLYDPLPNQVPTRFGDLRALVTHIDAIHRLEGNSDLLRHDTVPGCGPARDNIGYFTRLMVRMPGFETIVACLRRYGRDLTVEVMDWLRKTLADRLRGIRDPDGLTLVEVVDLLDRLEAPAVATPAPVKLPTLENQALGIAYDQLKTIGWINVVEVARRLTLLWRHNRGVIL